MNDALREALDQLSRAGTEQQVRSVCESFSPQLLQDVLAEMRRQKDGLVSRLRVAVQAHDDAVELQKLKQTNPRLAARIGLPGIPSQAAVGTPNQGG